MKNFSLFAIAALLLHAQHSFCADQKQLGIGKRFVLHEGAPCSEDYFYYEKWNPDHTRGYRESIGSQTARERKTILENVGHVLNKQGIKAEFFSFLIRPWQNMLEPPYLYVEELKECFYLTPVAPISKHCYSNDCTEIIDDIVRTVVKQIKDKKASDAAI